MFFFTLASMTSGTRRSIGGRRECGDIPVALDRGRPQLRVCMTLDTGFDFRRAVIARRRRHGRDVTRGIREVFVCGHRDRRPSSDTGMTRSARRYGCDEVGRRFWRGDMSGIAAVVLAIVTRLTALKRDHRMIHRRIREGSTRALVATVAIPFSCRVDDRNVRQRIRVIGYIDDARIA